MGHVKMKASFISNLNSFFIVSIIREMKVTYATVCYNYMGGRLPATAGMPANRTFLELSAGQSNWPEKNCVVLLPKKCRRPVLFPHEEKRFALWTAPCLSIKSGVYRVTYAIFRLPSLARVSTETETNRPKPTRPYKKRQ